MEVQSPYNRICISHNREGHRAFAVFLLSFFVGKCRRAVSGVRCRSPPLHLDFYISKIQIGGISVKYAPRKVYIKESGGYVELSYTDFCRRRQADKGYMDKLFIPVQGCLLEVVREQYADFYRDRERWRYLQKLDARNSLLSLDGFTDSEGNPLDFIADEAADIAETVVNAVMVDRLKAALPLLSDSEQELIQAIFFDGLSEREVGARLGITQSVVNKRKARILRKLRKIIEN
ncbi:sigma-70 family RNA polymerase sigma factor [Streptococcus macedonicus]